MSVEQISVLTAIVAVGVTLVGVILTSSRGLRQDMAQMESQLREDMKQGEARLREDMRQLREDMKQLGERVARMEHGQAKLEGLLEGLREAITGRVAAS